MSRKFSWIDQSAAASATQWTTIAEHLLNDLEGK